MRIKGQVPSSQSWRSRSKLTPERKAWDSMRWRCTNNNPENSRHYKDKGIEVCERWLDFQNFLVDMGQKPFPQATIERLDNSKGYEPGNCVWADYVTQNRNRRNVRWYTYDGRTQTISDWAKELGTSIATISDRLKRGWPLEAALTIEPRYGQKLSRIQTKNDF